MKINEALDLYASHVVYSGDPMREGIDLDEALAEIKKAIEEIIGEDEEVYAKTDVTLEEFYSTRSKNQLRKEQRTRLEKLFEEEVLLCPAGIHFNNTNCKCSGVESIKET